MKYLFEDIDHALFSTDAFIGSPIVSPSGRSIDMAHLSNLLRVLLVTDGTVTKTIEAYFWESVNVSILQQTIVSHASDAELSILQRDVELVGELSGREYVFARSYLNVSVMPKEFTEALASGNKGIGWLLRQTNREQYRQIVEIGFAKDLSDDAYPERYKNSIYRIYCITVEGQRLMQIAEFFPFKMYQ